jgi:flavin-dependent dehydrogenase
MRPRLQNGSRVCVVGGGPAGSFAALHLLRLAQARGLSLEVLIFEPRNFKERGPAGCNRCAGVLSSRLLAGLTDLGLSLPTEVVQAYIRAYEAHLDGEVYPIESPTPGSEIVSVYRGGGPRLGHSAGEASFDDFLLRQACARGARHLPARVGGVGWSGGPVVHTARQVFSADLLVLATGVNSRPPLDALFGYRSPRTNVMGQDEVRRPSDWPNDVVRTYFRHPRGLMFGALIPKGEYLNVSLLGDGLTPDAVPDFLEAQGLAPSLALSQRSLCGCTPRIAVQPAQRIFGDRWVAVGDAAVTRLYKDGIGSAFATAKAAMEAAVRHGIGTDDFRRFYAPACRRVARDNVYGKWLFRLWSRALITPRALRAWKTSLREEAGGIETQRRQMRILWGMFTGDEPYQDLLRLALNPGSLGALMRAALQERQG